jgi:DHA1 family tetracycline resistance protein-like MFS transporter
VGWAFLVGIPLMSLWGLAGPPIQSIMTRHVEPDEQGRLQGAVTSLGSFAGIFGPYLFAQIFAFWISPARTVHLPGFPFLVAAALVAVGIVVAARATRGEPEPALARKT